MKVFFYSAIFLILYVIADGFFDSAASDANRELAIYLQTQNLDLTKFYSVFSTIGDTIFYMGILFFLFFLCPDKLFIIIFLSFLTINAYLNCMLKIIYASARPFMEYGDVQSIGCETSMGRPSGHAQGSIFFYVFLSDFICNMIFSKKNQTKTMMFLKLNTRILTVFIIFLIGFSRIYKGAHSFNQVLLGWNYGQFMLFFYFTLRKPVHIYIKTQVEEIILKKQSKIRKILINLGSFFCFMLITVLIFTIRTQYTLFPEHWSENIWKKCQKNSHNSNILLKETILSSTHGCVGFGISLGFLIVKGTIRNELYWAAILNLKWWKWVVRFVLLAVLTMVIIGIPFLIKSDQGTDIYITLLLKNYLPFYVMGVALISFIPVLYKLFRVEVEGDLMKYYVDQEPQKMSKKLEFE